MTTKRSIGADTKETTGGFSDVSGIREDWTLDTYGYGPIDKNGTGPSALFFNFKNGAISLRLAEFDITPESAASFNAKYPKKTPISDEEAYTKAIAQQDANLIQIARVFVDKSEADIKGDNFEQLAKNFVHLLTTKGKNLKANLRLKVIYNSGGFLKISTSNGRFINLASEPIGDMSLKDWEINEIKNNKKSADSDKTVASASTEGTKKRDF